MRLYEVILLFPGGAYRITTDTYLSEAVLETAAMPRTLHLQRAVAVSGKQLFEKDYKYYLFYNAKEIKI
ncbi:MAG: hypothetical protein HDR03_12470 [Lachnospiraceae bacterium]|nr:hypothetical protein [Lachnospiraceae bacterium]